MASSLLHLSPIPQILPLIFTHQNTWDWMTSTCYRKQKYFCWKHTLKGQIKNFWFSLKHALKMIVNKYAAWGNNNDKVILTREIPRPEDLDRGVRLAKDPTQTENRLCSLGLENSTLHLLNILQFEQLCLEKPSVPMTHWIKGYVMTFRWKPAKVYLLGLTVNSCKLLTPKLSKGFSCMNYN